MRLLHKSTPADARQSGQAAKRVSPRRADDWLLKLVVLLLLLLLATPAAVQSTHTFPAATGVNTQK